MLVIFQAGGGRVVGRRGRPVAADHHHRLGDAGGPLELERSAGGDGEVADGGDPTGASARLGRGSRRAGAEVLGPSRATTPYAGIAASGATAPSTM